MARLDWDTSLSGKGTIDWAKSSINDPHIQDALKIIFNTSYAQRVMQHFKVNEADIVQLLDEYDTMHQELFALTPEMSSTMAQNNIESLVFSIVNNLTKHKQITVPGASQFSALMFERLNKEIQASRPSFFKMRSFIQRVPLARPIVGIYDNDLVVHNQTNPMEPPVDHNKYKPAPTAYATPDGVFVFNKQFCQALINWAYIKKIKPKHYFFKSNGGTIPDDYVYLEFLIFHEFLHYVDDDFFYNLTNPNWDHKLTNYVGDFRINYKLVKNGMEQLPIGLYSDNVNFDRYNDYKEVYNICKRGVESAWKPEIGMPVVDEKGNNGIITKIHPNGQIETTPVPEEKMEEMYKQYMDNKKQGSEKFAPLLALLED